jgi:hypothetical protein
MLKDLLEHIRTVHFALVVAASAMLIASLSNAKTPLEGAHNDAVALKYLSDEFPEIRRRVTTFAQGYAKARSPSSRF